MAIYTAPDDKREGLAKADIDGDGKLDIIADSAWFKHTGGVNFTWNPIDPAPQQYMRVVAGQLIPGGRPEIIQTPGDASGTGKWYSWDGSNWISHDLPVGEIIHGHSLEIGDVNQDGGWCG